MLRLVLAALAVAFAGALFAAPAHAQSLITTSWEQPVKLPNGSETTYRIEVVFDYVSNTAVQSAYDASGALVETIDVPPPPQPTAEEIALAHAVIEADAELSGFLTPEEVIIDGGYVLFDGICAEVRCLQFTLGPVDGSRIDRYVVVDLSTQTMASRNFDPYAQD